MASATLRLVTPDDVARMVEAAYEILETVGLVVQHPALLLRLAGAAGLTERNGRCLVARELASEIVAQAAASSPVRTTAVAQAPRIRVSTRAMFGADHRARQLRPLSRQDVIEGTRLIHALAPQGVSSGTCGTPQEAPLALQPLEQYLIGYRYSLQQTEVEVPVADEVRAAMREMQEIAEDPALHSSNASVWMISPLRLEGYELDELMTRATPPETIGLGSMPLMGLTGSADPWGVFTLSFAETVGAAAILRCAFPDARFGFTAHPQAMDLIGGRFAFGGAEWSLLELMRKEIYAHLGIEWSLKTCITSACMPDAQAQMEKTAGIALGAAWGFSDYSIYPLCADEVWSGVQCLFDVEAIHAAHHALRLGESAGALDDCVATLQQAAAESALPGELLSGMRRLRQSYRQPLLRRVFSAGQFIETGPREPLSEAEGKVAELIAGSSHEPDTDRLGRMMTVYERACRRHGVAPLRLDG